MQNPGLNRSPVGPHNEFSNPPENTRAQAVLGGRFLGLSSLSFFALSQLRLKIVVTSKATDSDVLTSQPRADSVWSSAFRRSAVRDLFGKRCSRFNARSIAGGKLLCARSHIP